LALCLKSDINAVLSSPKKIYLLFTKGVADMGTGLNTIVEKIDKLRPTIKLVVEKAKKLPEVPKQGEDYTSILSQIGELELDFRKAQTTISAALSEELPGIQVLPKGQKKDPALYNSTEHKNSYIQEITKLLGPINATIKKIDAAKAVAFPQQTVITPELRVAEEQIAPQPDNIATASPKDESQSQEPQQPQIEIPVASSSAAQNDKELPSAEHPANSSSPRQLELSSPIIDVAKDVAQPVITSELGMAEEQTPENIAAASPKEESQDQETQQDSKPRIEIPAASSAPAQDDTELSSDGNSANSSSPRQLSSPVQIASPSVVTTHSSAVPTSAANSPVTSDGFRSDTEIPFSPNKSPSVEAINSGVSDSSIQSSNQTNVPEQAGTISSAANQFNEAEELEYEEEFDVMSADEDDFLTSGKSISMPARSKPKSPILSETSTTEKITTLFSYSLQGLKQTVSSISTYTAPAIQNLQASNPLKTPSHPKALHPKKIEPFTADQRAELLKTIETLLEKDTLTPSAELLAAFKNLSDALEEAEQSLFDPLNNFVTYHENYNKLHAFIFKANYFNLVYYYQYQEDISPEDFVLASDNYVMEKTLEGYISTAIQFAESLEELELLSLFLSNKHAPLASFLNEKLHYFRWKKSHDEAIKLSSASSSSPKPKPKSEQEVPDEKATPDPKKAIEDQLTICRKFFNSNAQSRTLSLVGQFYHALILLNDNSMDLEEKSRNTKVKEKLTDIKNAFENDDPHNYCALATFELAKLIKKIDPKNNILYAKLLTEAIRKGALIEAWEHLFQCAKELRTAKSQQFGDVVLAILSLDSTPELAQIETWLLEIAESEAIKHPTVNYELALYYARKNQFSKSFIHFKKAAEYGHQTAQKELNNYFNFGRVIELTDIVLREFGRHDSSIPKTSGFFESAEPELLTLVSTKRIEQYDRLKTINDALYKQKTFTSEQIKKFINDIIELTRFINGDNTDEIEGGINKALYYLQSKGTVLNNGSQMGKRLTECLTRAMPWIMVDKELKPLEDLAAAPTPTPPKTSSYQWAHYFSSSVYSFVKPVVEPVVSYIAPDPLPANTEKFKTMGEFLMSGLLPRQEVQEICIKEFTGFKGTEKKMAISTSN
jgi:hypothetical protein